MSEAVTTQPIKHSLLTRLFHNIGALLIVAAWVLVEMQDNFDNAIMLHKAIGASFLLWTVARLINMTVRKRLPQLPQPKWQVAVAHLTHAALYLCMLAMPLSGILMSVYGGRPVSVFGLFEIPVFVTPDRDMSRFFNEIHGDLIFPALIALIVAHVGAALYHQFILKDRLLTRMF